MNSRVICVVAVSGVLAACTPAGQGSPPAPKDDFPTDAVVAQARRWAETQQIVYARGPAEDCSKYFDVADVQFVDKRVVDTNAIAQVDVSVRAKSTYEPHMFASNNCFKSPTGRWDAGQVVTLRREYVLQKWDSGWRFAQ